MDKRYQVFVSSTYADLRDERNRVIQTLMEMDCIPSGMELFPAADEDQFEFIKKVIDDCDYYLLVIGGRYGSTTEEGVSYTEKEYEYAISRGMKVIALLHQEPDNLPSGKTDKDPVLAKRLEEFRAKVQTGRLVKYWNHAAEIPGIVALSLTTTIKRHPAIGWVRGNISASNELLEEVNELRKKNQELLTSLAAANAKQARPAIANMAGLDAKIKLAGKYQPQSAGQTFVWEREVTFEKIFALISPELIEHPVEGTVQGTLARAVFYDEGKRPNYVHLDNQSIQTVRIQLQALGLINANYSATTKGGRALFWSLTEQGNAKMLDLRVIRKSEEEPAANSSPAPGPIGSIP